jgi:hypothetical protein
MRRAPAAKLVRDAAERRGLAEEIAEAGKIFDDVYLLTSIFYSESSFNQNALGSAGEMGMGQVGNTTRARCRKNGFNLGLRAEQVKCTAWILSEELKKCGDINGALTAYVGWGTCKTTSKKKQRQVKYKLRLANKLREIGELHDVVISDKKDEQK